MKPQSSSFELNRWFVCPRANPNAVSRLFFFPYAGGGPAVFTQWCREVPDEIEARVAHYPGRGSRYNEPPMEDLLTSVEQLAQAIRPFLDKPFAFLGHSLGGLVAFELSRHLRKHDLPQPQILFISGCGAPHLSDPNPPIHKLPDSEFLRALRELNGIPNELFNQPEALDVSLPTLRADFKAFENYTLADEPALDCPIVAFGGLEDPRVSRERLEGWALQTHAQYKSNYFPGDHFFINSAKEFLIGSITAEMSKSIFPTSWIRPPDTLDLAPDQVDLWRISLDLSPDSVKSFESTLSADETERAARFYFPADRQRFVVAHGCLRDILARYLHIEPAQLNFFTDEYGKPAIQNQPLEFNLSHSGDFVLVSVAWDREVGVDIERLRADMELESIASRYFSPGEVSELFALPPEQRVIGFFNGWTRKEAYIKAQGLGLSLPLDSFDVSLSPNEPVLLRATRPDKDESSRWTMFSLNVDHDYASALVVEGQGMKVRYWDWKFIP